MSFSTPTKNTDLLPVFASRNEHSDGKFEGPPSQGLEHANVRVFHDTGSLDPNYQINHAVHAFWLEHGMYHTCRKADHRGMPCFQCMLGTYGDDREEDEFDDMPWDDPRWNELLSEDESVGSSSSGIIEERPISSQLGSTSDHPIVIE
jgi:hypothetical protein